MEIIYLLLFLFIVRSIKNLLFWEYLWQLKNYHIGRFLAHFSTSKGKKLFINPLIKIVILALTLIEFNLFYVLLFIYLIESLEVFKRKVILPQKTSKTIFLSFIIFLIFASFIVFASSIDPFSAFLLILIFDILTPIIVSLIILLFQPITVLLRNRTIRKAIKKRKTLDNLLVIGVTGSYGKSSTKEYLKTLLENDFKVVTTNKNENSEMGISRCILNDINDEHEIFICEMGAYNRGGIKLLTKIAQPKIGVLTGINNQHLATFGSQKNIIKAKFELIDALPLEGLAVLNWDNAYIKENFKSEIANIKYCGDDLWAEEITENSFNLCSPKGCHEIKHKIKGSFNIPNLLGAISVAKKLGMTIEEIQDRVLKIEGGLNIKKRGNFDIIDATYSSNFNGIISHLEELKKWKGSKIIVMPCLIELGKDAKIAHYEIGRKIGEVCDLAIITTNDYKKEIIRGANHSQMKNIIFSDNAEKIYNRINLCDKADSVILLESRVSNKLIKKYE
ncbi:MAG: UDP-N-acetylmuramoyl-tripeptide--D-alanyl-D-alanine ligase [Candidatus Pacebacteria bacterium]|nr:UDP-N-acetylmuramoyl-tripeptide--D-alanyl-D-alanine ligase [Candidatus Paceibacterota bacterium]MDD2757246.1 UDP-N-acetylmuramoyl-tripeptide--D-alanyl-D-alanine ligase [Candidatus Paceibacterota bacterium]MDD3283778.1 UDP-N-acetylmuramoyl-tripeptide--D-alanyl-D-alanine ligase [Candidatus Paceibacterota bacterium]MDD3969984.1 UDP-N-acetylmuramoyl-tripeptide--D-alanyl-D-alanine ligase [Candidatus Paceibacterota bacterium]MDD4738039.1 UDP-N-acetylmuramoyl-tripeptide--D-alanyl-D-alanine ligase [